MVNSVIFIGEIDLILLWKGNSLPMDTNVVDYGWP